MLIEWPERVLVPAQSAINLLSRSLRGSSSLAGGVQSVSTDAGIWVADFSGFPLVTTEKLLLWRAIDGLTEGTANPIDVPLMCHEKRFQPGVGVGIGSARKAVPHSDGSYFNDSAGYVGSYTNATTAAAILRAVSLTVTTQSDLQPGQHFSVNHTLKGNRLYRIRTVAQEGETAQITFRPPLREAIPGGTRLEFDRPLCRMKLASDDAMRLEFTGARAHAFPSVSFVEDL